MKTTSGAWQNLRDTLRQAIRKTMGRTVYVPMLTSRQQRLGPTLPALAERFPITTANRLNYDDGSWLFMLNKDRLDAVGPKLG